jgi:hypothetical protein
MISTKGLVIKEIFGGMLFFMHLRNFFSAANAFGLPGICRTRGPQHSSPHKFSEVLGLGEAKAGQDLWFTQCIIDPASDRPDT